MAVLSDDEPGPTNHLDPLNQEYVPDGTHAPNIPFSRLLLLLHCRCAYLQLLRPVSIPDIVCDMAGNNAEKKLADFDRRYIPDGVPQPDVSVTGVTGEHRSNLKQKEKGMARSLAEVFAYLTFNTSSLNESKKLLSIITNVSSIISYI